MGGPDGPEGTIPSGSHSLGGTYGTTVVPMVPLWVVPSVSPSV
jgi:hypothetical protein